MITPSITFDHTRLKPVWSSLSLDDVKALIRNDVAELQIALKLQADDLAAAKAIGRQPDYRLRNQVTAWERTQDVHWSWYKEMLDDGSTATSRPSGLGSKSVGSSHGV